jgi:hypothetical protein
LEETRLLPSPTTPDEAGRIVELLSYSSVTILRNLLKPVRRARQLACRGTSITSTAIQHYLSAALSIRKVLPSHGALTLSTIETVCATPLCHLQLNLDRLSLSSAVQEWLVQTLPRFPMADMCDFPTRLDTYISQVQKLLHYRKRREFTSTVTRAIHKREVRMLSMQLKPVIRSLTGQQRISADHSSVKLASGSIAMDARDVHYHHTEHWRQWMSGPPQVSEFAGSHIDMRRVLHDFSYFNSLVNSTNIPFPLRKKVWYAICAPWKGNRPAANVHSKLSHRLRWDEPPSFEEFESYVKDAPSGTAGGVSGLTYNQLKSWPVDTLRLCHESLCIMIIRRHSIANGIAPSYGMRSPAAYTPA